MQRRERTRHLIELGGLVQKAGLVELVEDDRATLYGALLELVARAGGDDAGNVLALWSRRGKRAFDAEADIQVREASPSKKAFLKLADAAANLEQHLEAEGASVLTAAITRLEQFLQSGAHDSGYPTLKQAMADVEGFALVGDGEAAGRIFLLAYSEMLDAIEARNG